MKAKIFLKKVKSESYLLKKLPLLAVLLFSAIAFVNFHAIYVFSPDKALNITSATSLMFSAKSFFFTFYTFFLLFLVSSFFMLFTSNFYAKILFLITGLISSSLMAYSTDQLFTIKIFIYIAFLICTVYGYSHPEQQFLSTASVIFFIFLEILPGKSSVREAWVHDLTFSFVNTCASILILSLLLSMLIKSLCKNLIFAAETAAHQNLVMNQMTELNNKLQEYAKSHGEEAVQNERMRITRDMHDSCGYAFVNITAIIDALMSNPHIEGEKLSDSLLTVRNLASTGLKETRKTLRHIREIESPAENNLSAIYEIQKIFMEITGINVEIHSGNLKENYGITINAIIMHTLQEGLTNSIRHGRAKNIFVSFWDDINLLTMVVKDDGVGAKEVVKGIGLAGMEERLSKVMGSLEVSTPKEGGFRLEIKIPLVNIGADELKL